MGKAKAKSGIESMRVQCRKFPLTGPHRLVRGEC